MRLRDRAMAVSSSPTNAKLASSSLFLPDLCEYGDASLHSGTSGVISQDK
jgi:hypothetical protein